MRTTLKATGVDTRAAIEYKRAMATDPPLCPECGQPASPALPSHDYDWECRNDACPREGLPVEATSSS